MGIAEDYPEHARLTAISKESQAIGEFLDWLSSEHHVALCTRHGHSDACWTQHIHDFGCDERCEHPNDGKHHHGGGRGSCTNRCDRERELTCGMLEDASYPISWSIEQLLARYFEIDTNKIELEKRAMLEALRKAHT